MKIVQALKLQDGPFQFYEEPKDLENPLVLVFGNRICLEDPEIFNDVKSFFPTGHIVFGSTAGEICDTVIRDNSVVLTAIEFERSSYKVSHKNITDFNGDGHALGAALLEGLPAEDLVHVLIISEGSQINGSTLIKGLESRKKQGVGISGGICGDGNLFERTLAAYNEMPKEGEVIAIGFYGSSLEITTGNSCGWIPFGPERVVTKSVGNLLFELDGRPALELYEKYLGPLAEQLPHSALLYPLSVSVDGHDHPVVRTILNINKEDNTMILAGDIPENSKVQLMFSSVEDIVNGSRMAGHFGINHRKKSPQLALLISCLGRKMVLDQRAEEEIEEMRAVIGERAIMTGFYSYGEIAPFSNGKLCRLHNQTMTITLFSE